MTDNLICAREGVHIVVSRDLSRGSPFVTTIPTLVKYLNAETTAPPVTFSGKSDTYLARCFSALGQPGTHDQPLYLKRRMSPEVAIADPDTINSEVD